MDKKIFPVAKYYFLDEDEVLRSLVINNLRFFDLSIVDDRLKQQLRHKFKKEFEKLRKTCKVKEGKQGLEVKDWLINSKIFYSKKVLKKCKKIISQDYPNISEEIMM